MTFARSLAIKAGMLAAVGLFGAAGLAAGGARAEYPHVAPLNGTGYVALTPARILDTRDDAVTVDGLAAGTGLIGQGGTLDLKVTGRGGVPAVGVGAVVLNVTTVDQTMRSFVTIFPKGSPRPVASNLNPNPGVVQPNLVIAKVGADGEISIFNNAGSLNLIADVQGWFPSPIGSAYNPLVPARVLETRPAHSTIDGLANGGGVLSAGETIDLVVTGRGGVPATNVAAVVLNVTAADHSGPTFLTVFPTGSTRPNTSNLNPNPGLIAPNLVIAKVGTDGNFSGAAAENGESRVLVGFHFRNAVNEGLEHGRDIANRTVNQVIRAIP